MNTEMLLHQVSARLQEVHELQSALHQVQWFVRNMAEGETIEGTLKKCCIDELRNAKRAAGRINREITSHINFAEGKGRKS